jgi:hypothetical protein
VKSDLIVYPARYLGQLVAAGTVRPLRQSALEDRELALDRVLPAIRQGELALGGVMYAVPFGSRVVGRAAEASTSDGTIDKESLQGDPFSAAWMFLARAASWAKHPNQSATLFHPETMKPRIDGPPFLRALTRHTTD